MTQVFNFFLGSAILGMLGFYLLIYVRSTDSDLVSGIPIFCDLIGSQFEDYDNSKCLPVMKIEEDIESKKKDIEKRYYESLSFLIPYKIKTEYITSSAEVLFIEKISKNRVPINKVFSEFERVRAMSNNNAECGGFVFNDRMELNVTCSFYGSSLKSSVPGSSTQTSRYYALQFRNNLVTEGKIFTLLDPPKDIGIQQFNGGDDPKKSAFSTVSTMNFRLQYNLDSK